MEFCIAATASTSAIASLTVWKDGLGSYFWQLFLFVAAIFSVAKPIIGITKKVRLYEEVLSGYRSLSYELLQLRTSISAEQQYGEAHKLKLQDIMSKHAQLSIKSPESIENKKVKNECVDEVLAAFPVKSFYVPKGVSYGKKDYE